MPELPWVFWRFDLISLVDIVIVALILYWVITIVQGTRATQLIWGIVLLLIVSAVLSTRREFSALYFLIQSSIPALLVAIPVVFQPELRRALEQLGHTGALLNRPFTSSFSHSQQLTNAIDEVCRAAGQLARQRYGALIVIERDTGLQEFVERSVPLDALATRQLLITIFFPNTPLHDGAVIIRNDRVAAAAAVLPLTQQELGGNLGTRHRAAIGISEESDAVALVVSEETGQISVATDGRLVRNLSQDRLRRHMLLLFRLERGAAVETPDRPGLSVSDRGMSTIDRDNLRKQLALAVARAAEARAAVGRSLDTATLLRLLLAGALAFGLWTYVTLRDNPVVNRTLPNRPVEVRGQPEGTVLMTTLPAVDIVVAGPELLIESPTRPMVASVDLSRLAVGPGQRASIRVEEVPRGVTLVRVNPEEVVVEFEPLARAELPVTAVLPNVPANVRPEQPLLEPRSISVSGARSTLAAIARVVVRPEVGDPNERTRLARPIPLDSSGREVTGPRLELTPKIVTVTFPARTVTGSKTVPVRAIVVGQPAAGYQLDSISTLPSAMTVLGEAEALEAVTALETEPIDIGGRQQALSQPVRLRVPTGVSAEQATVQVEVGISPIRARTRLTLAAFPRGLGPGLRAQIVPGTIDVTLQGPVPVIQAVDVGALRAEVNLQGLGPGTHRVPPKMAGPGLDRLTVAETLPELVTVQIAAEPTPAPTAAPAPTVAPAPTGTPAPATPTAGTR